MYESILKLIKTKDDLEKLHYEIESLLASLFQDEGKAFESLMKTKVRSEVSKNLYEIFLKNESLDKRKHLQALKDVISSCRVLSLTLAFEPSQDALERISTYIKKEVGSDAVLEIGYNPYIIGGGEIIFEGKYRDFSFKRIFEKEFERSRDEIMRILGSVEEKDQHA